ncbi:MAG TPA: protein kinase [Polyangiaceae bacterium]|jgi:tRNA A-37 threonylcarbamoyl transferase component Bud32
MGRKDKRGSDTLDAIASARTVPGATPDPLASADTVLAGPVPSTSTPRLPQSGGEVLGNRYEILGELGRGGEGVVYRARDLKADAIVALKLLQHDEGSKARLQRFRRELQMARKVTHPNVVRIHDLIELPGRFGLSMELVEGESLDARIARGPLGRDELVTLAVDLARALAAAHEAGVTHRDLKPANVLLRARDGHAVVTDFGVSRAHGAKETVVPLTRDLTPLQLTREGVLIGTPQYMAPEQLDMSANVGPAADVYAFGLLMVEAATGKPLHAAETFDELRRNRMNEAPPPLREMRPDLPRRLCDVVDRSLAREPGGRYPGGVELLAALQPVASPLGAPLWIALGALAVAGVGAAVFVRRAPPAAAPAPPAVVPAPPGTPPLSLHLTNPRRITTGDGCEEFPSFTPDGRSVVYDGTVGRNAYVYLLDVAPGSTPRQLTQVQGWDIAPSVSPGGDRIAFVRFEGERVGAHVAPFDGSTPPRLLVKGAVRPSWTRDGKAVWAGSGTPLAAYDAQTGALVRTLSGGPPVHTAQTEELADGSVIAVLAMDDSLGSNLGGLAYFPPDGAMRWLLKGDLDEVLGVTTDRRHALVSRTRAAANAELLDVPIDGSPSTSLVSTGVSARKGLRFSPGDRQVVWSACAEVPQIMGFDGAGRLRRVVENDLLEPSWLVSVPGTKQVAVVSTRGGRPEPWLVGLSTDALPQAIPVGTLTVRDITVSHDGASFVVSVPGDGLYLGPLRGPPGLRRLTSDASDATPAFVAGDAQVVFTRHPSGAHARVMSVPVEGGAPTPVLDDDSDGAAPSPVDARIVYLLGPSSAEVVPRVWDGHSSRPLSALLPVGRYGYPRFSPDGRRVALVRGDTDLLEVDAASGAILRTLATPTGDQLAFPAYTPSGLVFIRVRFQGNLWLADTSL